MPLTVTVKQGPLINKGGYLYTAGVNGGANSPTNHVTERGGLMRVETDPLRGEVILIGANGSYEARLTWVSALNLGSMLQAAAIEVEPPPPPGKRYEPAIERDRR
jgi:hypothetical protein